MDKQLRTVAAPCGERWPALGLGTWRMGESAGNRPAEVRAVREALDIGYRLIDTAEMYGEGGAEKVVGQALADALRGGLAREAVTIVTKVYPHNASLAGVQAACERSRRRLQVDQIDLYLLHWRGNVTLAETVDGFETLRARGQVRHWGVSNFDVEDLRALAPLRSRSLCQANQVYYSLASRALEFDLLPMMRAQGLPLMAYSPIDQGRLATRQSLISFARRFGLSAAQLALAWVMRHDDVIAIPKAMATEHLRANHVAASVELDLDTLDELDRLFPPPESRQPLAMT